jgi:hypothetical protein
LVSSLDPIKASRAAQNWTELVLGWLAWGFLATYVGLVQSQHQSYSSSNSLSHLDYLVSTQVTRFYRSRTGLDSKETFIDIDTEELLW